MEFCDKCGGLMMPHKAGKSTALVCRNCGKKKTSSAGRGDFKISSTMQKKDEKIIVVDKKAKVDVLPKTNIACPKCEHVEAFWWMQQTRASDEPPTRFYRCTKCENVWREYE
ncbi:MAG TPA: transcription factor S [archaeon]|nr:transcription factor S [archaeon]